MSLEPDDRRRPKFGVVVSLLDLGDGTSRVIIDDVISAEPQRSTTWAFDLFYTHKKLDSQAIHAMELPDGEYQGLGQSVLARLLALNRPRG